VCSADVLFLFRFFPSCDPWQRYDGDVSRLCDIVRQCIVFESCHDQLKCLHAMCADEHVVVLTVKHNLHWLPISLNYSGFKRIVVKFVITTDAAVARGVVGHVCELQLVVKEMYELWSADRHTRYQVCYRFRCRCRCRCIHINLHHSTTLYKRTRRRRIHSEGVSSRLQHVSCLQHAY